MKSLIFVVLSSNLCVQVNAVLTSGEKREGSLYKSVAVYLFSETINYLLISLIYIVHLNPEFISLICFSGLEFRILHLNPQYIVKSSAILRFL